MRMVYVLGESFEAIAHQSVIAQAQFQTRKGKCLLAEQLFGMCNIHISRVVFGLCMSEKKKEDERNGNFCLFFSAFVFARGTSGAFSATE